jgi:UDP-galactopyranose mutase
MHNILIVGCGLSGMVIAERFANEKNMKVLIIDKRNHIGGNIYDYIDLETNILVSKYGAHLFHTNSERVWNYIQKFSKWIRWDHKVLGKINNMLLPIPVNINTVNALCGENIQTTDEMNKWLEKNQVKYERIQNGEDMAKSRVGDKLYEKIFKDYTFKQWNCYPGDLDASVLARIPIRNNFDNRYFDDKYQALPENGYTEFAKSLINNKNIEVRLNTDYFDFINNNDLSTFEHVIYTGPIDRYYESCGLPKLKYRSINFINEVHKNMNYYQLNSVINYPEMNVPYTRIVEYKHFLNQESPHTIIAKEVTTDEGEPYYPVPNKENQELYAKYKEMAEKEKNVHFIGRLANYKYFNMDQAILNALEYFDKYFQ